MSGSSNTPSIPSGGVFTVSTSTLIDAPIQKVWKVLLDFPSYREWNPFVRGQTIVNPNTKKPLSDQTPAAGKHLLLYPVHIPPTMNDKEVWFPHKTFLVITCVDHENYRCAWEALMWPRLSFIFYAVRWQYLTVSNGKTKYEVVEVFGGLIAYIILFFLKNKLNKSFGVAAEALKMRCEQA